MPGIAGMSGGPGFDSNMFDDIRRIVKRLGYGAFQSGIKLAEPEQSLRKDCLGSKRFSGQ